MNSDEFITEEVKPGAQKILDEIAGIYNIEPKVMKRMAEIVKISGMKLNVIESLIQISQQCQPFIRTVGWDNCFKLFRGVAQGGGNEFIEKRVRLDARSPKSMDPELYRKINDYFSEVYGQPFRMAMLTTGDQFHTRLFGTTFFVFPKGDFKFLWHEDVEDFNFALNNYRSSEVVKSQITGSSFSTNNTDIVGDLFLNKYVKELDWHTIDMVAAIEYNAEIMIRTKGYWGINANHEDDIPGMTEIMKLAI